LGKGTEKQTEAAGGKWLCREQAVGSSTPHSQGPPTTHRPPARANEQIHANIQHRRNSAAAKCYLQM